VRDGSAEGTLPLRALHVHVDPLAIAGQLGELPDHLLRHLELRAPRAEIVADLLAQCLDVVESNFPHGVSCPPPGDCTPFRARIMTRC
jgi:hypothetical protein